MNNKIKFTACDFICNWLIKTYKNNHKNSDILFSIDYYYFSLMSFIYLKYCAFNIRKLKK